MGCTFETHKAQRHRKVALALVRTGASPTFSSCEPMEPAICRCGSGISAAYVLYSIARL